MTVEIDNKEENVKKQNVVLRIVKNHFTNVEYKRSVEQIEKEKYLYGKVKFNRWILFPVAVLVQACIGSLYSWSIYNKGIDKAVYGDENRGMAPITFYIAVAVFGFTVPFMGPVLERRGPTIGILVGGSSFALGHFIVALGIKVKAIWLIYIGYGFFSGYGLGITYISPVSTLQKWFPDYRGLSSGFAVCGFGAGSIIFSKLPLPIIDSVGIALNFVILGSIFLVVLVAMAFIIRVPPPDYTVHGMNSDGEKVESPKPTPTGTENDTTEPSDTKENGGEIEDVSLKLPSPDINSTAEDTKYSEIDIESQQQKSNELASSKDPTKKKFTFIESITSREFLLIYPMFLANCLFGLVAISRLSNLVQDIFGESKQTASTVVSINGGFNLFGRLAFAALSDKIGRKIIFILTLTIQVIIVGVLPNLTKEDRYIAFIVVIWLLTACYGAGFGIIPALLCDLFGSKNVGACHAVILTAWSIAGVAGGLIFTKIYDTKRDSGYTVHDYQVYETNFYWILAVLLTGWCIIWFVRVTPKQSKSLPFYKRAINFIVGKYLL